ncbi:MAG: cold shock and DUF1294 domain-containing protein [Isosphaeraceae bacterium]
MRRSGTIRTWKDDEGYGFIVPEGGGPDVFVHISAFGGRGKGRRPVAGDLVTFELSTDKRARPRAQDVTFGDEGVVTRALDHRGTVPIVVGLAYLGLLAVAAGFGRLPWLVPILVLGMSAAAFVIYAVDKSAARNGRRRVPESTLHTLSLLGGWPGAMLAQQTLRHKSSKTSFRLVYWATVALNVLAVLALTVPTARHALLTWLQAGK